jgi:hypothetical protein
MISAAHRGETNPKSSHAVHRGPCEYGSTLASDGTVLPRSDLPGQSRNNGSRSIGIVFRRPLDRGITAGAVALRLIGHGASLQSAWLDRSREFGERGGDPQRCR